MGLLDGSVLMAMLAFGSIIFIHELGHFIFAKKVGIRVEKFYLGFDFRGLKFFSFTYKGTEYGIGILPLGGYVKMAGQEDFGSANKSGAADEFPSKTIWQRIQVLFGGVLFNFLSAFIFCVLALWAGYRLTTNEINGVVPGSPAWEIGLKPGDKIISYNGIATPSYESINTEVLLGGVNKDVELKLIRDGKEMTFMVRPRKDYSGMAHIGVRRQSSLSVKSVIVDSGADKAGIKIGDRINEINGVGVDDWNDLPPLVQKFSKEDKILKVGIEREGQKMVLPVEVAERKYGFLGFYPKQRSNVYAVLDGSEAEKLGIEMDMKVISVEGENYWEIHKRDKFIEKKSLKFVFENNGKQKNFVFTGNMMDFKSQVSFGPVGKNIVIDEVVKESNAEKLNLKAGDKILKVAIDGEKTLKNPLWFVLQQFIQYNPNKDISLTVKRGDKEMVLNGKIGERDDAFYILGVQHGAKAKDDDTALTVLMWPFQMLRISYLSFWKLISGVISPTNISGPVGIFDVTLTIAEQGLDILLYLMAFISIHIAFFNILPLPVLDGGHLMFCIVEAIKGKPVSPKIMEKMTMAGLVLLLSILVFATYNDIQKLINS